MGRKRKGGGNNDRRVHLDDQQIHLWFSEGKTAIEIAGLVGCSTSPSKKALTKMGLHREARPRPGAISRERNPSWKGGRRIRRDGYVVVWSPAGDQLEHQVVMEQQLGRSLTSEEVVHHIDGNKANNSLSNLKLMSRSDHIREHLPDMHAARYRR